MTNEFLSQDVGRISSASVQDSYQLLQSWSKMASPTGATQAETILTRLEEESLLGNNSVHLSAMHYATVRMDSNETKRHTYTYTEREDETSCPG